MKRAAPWLFPALVAGAIAPFLRGDGGDTWLFVAAGRTLFSPHWSHAFADPSIQVGPLQLALYGSVGRSGALLAAVLAVATVLVLQIAARRAGVTSPRVIALIGIAAIVTGLSTNAFEAGHPADTLLPLLWVIAAADARNGRTARAGLIVGLSAGLETWGILGLAVLAVSRRSIAFAVAAAVALYLPFVAAGHFAMGSYAWPVSNHSLLRVVLGAGASAGWPLRLLQGAVALAAGLLAARTRSLWLVPFVVVAVRLLFDPVLSDYYFAGLVGPALVGLAVFSRSRSFSFTRGQSSSMTAYQAESRL